MTDIELDIEMGVEALNKALQSEDFLKGFVQILARYADDPSNFLNEPIEVPSGTIAVYDALRRSHLESLVSEIITKTRYPCPACIPNPDGTERGHWKPFEILALENQDVLDQST